MKEGEKREECEGREEGKVRMGDAGLRAEENK